MSADIQQLVNLQGELAHRVSQLDQLNTVPQNRYAQGLQIYQRNLHLTAARALTNAYPTITKMLGDAAMRTLAKRLLQTQLPTQGDWGLWGNGLDHLLSASELNQQLPFLPDMAKLEWQVHLSSRGQTVPFDTPPLSALSAGNLETALLELQPHVKIFESRYPVVELWQAHKPWRQDYTPPATAVSDIIKSAHMISHSLIYQRSPGVCIQAISLTDYSLVRDIKNKLSLAEVINRYGDAQVSQWLGSTIQKPLIANLHWR